MGVAVTKWDMAETASGGPFPEVLQHEIFLNCILARPGCPVFVPAAAKTAPRTLTVIGDIACDPTSDFSPIKVYDRATDWARAGAARRGDPAARRDGDRQPALASPRGKQRGLCEAAAALAAHPHTTSSAGVWGRAFSEFTRHTATL